MRLDVLVAEIGSTTTLVNGFADIDGEAHFVGQGQAPTSVLEGDVRKGLEAAREDLSRKLGSDIEYSEFLAASSAAGGLGMTVHGLVYDMTARAAQAAALGAGAVIRMTTAGKLTDFDLAEIRSIAPKLILLAGGTDHGERETALFNAHVLAGAGLNIPVIYAGNIQNRAAVKEIFAKAGVPLFITDNVYPKLDLLNIEPARRIIHRAFEENIVLAPGMEHIRDIVNGEIMPTPGAVMEAARFLYERIGDLVCFDVGGATTDVHSVTPGTEEIARIQTVPEPMAKRTVEGDLGCYVNAMNVAEQMGRERLAEEIGCREDELESLRKPIPESGKEFAFSEAVCRYAAKTALERHA
ncbi:MAG: glutamate mutase L, partial [bacterium]|nr:glutamate mutase L [bacterium]